MASARLHAGRGGWARRVVVMAREPVAGAVKTRLARHIGIPRATATYRTIAGNVIARLHGDPRWQLVLALTPHTALTTRVWPRTIARIAQGNGDLGARMQRLFDCLPPGPVVIIGTDIPLIDRARIAEAFTALGNAEAVIGPAADGGYWLVGAARRRPPPRFFTNVRWSGACTLADTKTSLAGHSVTEIATLDDIDDHETWCRLASPGARRILPRRKCYPG